MSEVVDNIPETYPENELTVLSALKMVLESCRSNDVLSVGATEVARLLYRLTPEEDSEKYELIVMAKDLLKEYQDIILFKAKELNIPVLYVDTRKELASAMPNKPKNIGAVGIKKFMDNGREKAFIMNAYSN